ncbi:MAG TPA: SDR family oxidoreductase [Phycisphaerales bacterium]|nr:SDR family oxidoreductase [Phycisphaerales bacterium]
MKSPIALITGSSHGIGQFLSQRLESEGWQVVKVDRQEGPPETLLYDLSHPDQCQELIAEIKQRVDHLDLLVNNAAVMKRESPEELTLNDWQFVLHTNLTAPFLLTRGLAPWLRKGRGRVINMTSTRAHMSEPNTESYSATKGGLLALTHAMAISLGPKIKVNAVSPGWIDVAEEELRDIDHQQHPAGRVGRPQDIASLISYLASPEADFITGSEFIIDGGMTRKMIYEE